MSNKTLLPLMPRKKKPSPYKPQQKIPTCDYFNCENPLPRNPKKDNGKSFCSTTCLKKHKKSESAFVFVPITKRRPN
jgi:hypothetical protein